MTGLSPAGTRPCRTHLAALAFRELRSDNGRENEYDALARVAPRAVLLGASKAPERRLAHALADTLVVCEEVRTERRFADATSVRPVSSR